MKPKSKVLLGSTSKTRCCFFFFLFIFHDIRVLLLNIPVLYLMYFLVCSNGLITFSYFSSKRCDPLANEDVSSANQVVDWLISQTKRRRRIAHYYKNSACLSARLHTVITTLVIRSLDDRTHCVRSVFTHLGLLAKAVRLFRA